MRVKRLVPLLVVVLPLCSGCMTQTVTGNSAKGTEPRKPLSQHTYWIWQPGFWHHP